MKMFSRLTLCAVASSALLSAGGASAGEYGNYSIKGLATTNMTYTTIGAITTSRTNAYNGVGTIFVNTVSTGMNSGYLCTASLINAYTVLSAAHCIYDHNESTGALDPVTRIQLFLPSFGERGVAGTEVYTATSFAYNPLYNDPSNPGHDPMQTGDIGSGYDTSLITLDRNAVGHDIYSLYTGSNPLGQYLEVGTGTVGGPTGTDTSRDFEKRTGSNLFELYGNQLFSDVTKGVVLSDFDDGTAAHDVFGNLSSSLRQTGIANEADSSPGDSGGPEFNAAGQIVAVTSFGITGGIFSTSAAFPDGFCGTGSIDPYSAGGGTTPTSVDNGTCTNSSVGEIAGDTLVSYNMAFINAYLAAHPNAGGAVPEPATWAMMIAGFGMVGAAARRRRAKVSVTFA